MFNAAGEPALLSDELAIVGTFASEQRPAHPMIGRNRASQAFRPLKPAAARMGLKVSHFFTQMANTSLHFPGRGCAHRRDTVHCSKSARNNPPASGNTGSWPSAPRRWPSEPIRRRRQAGSNAACGSHQSRTTHTWRPAPAREQVRRNGLMCPCWSAVGTRAAVVAGRMGADPVDIDAACGKRSGPARARRQHRGRASGRTPFRHSSRAYSIGMVRRVCNCSGGVLPGSLT